MKLRLILFLIMSIQMLIACDPQSEFAKKGVEKYGPTPTPSISPTPVEVPIDPADVVQVDTSTAGPLLLIGRGEKKGDLNCNKFNRVMVNSNGNVLTIKGACSQIMVNGSDNQIKADAVTEIIFNGGGNNLGYSRYANGKRPTVVDNYGGNVSEKIARTEK